MAWTKTRDWPGQGGRKGEVSEKPAARQEEAATEPGELAGCGWTWEQGRAAKCKSSSQRTEAAAGGLRACLFSASGDVSVLSVPQRHVRLQNPDWVMMSKGDKGIDGGPEDQKPLM